MYFMLMHSSVATVHSSIMLDFACMGRRMSFLCLARRLEAASILTEGLMRRQLLQPFHLAPNLAGVVRRHLFYKLLVVNSTAGAIHGLYFFPQ